MLISSLTTFLKYFSDVAHYRNFSQAAKKNFISQSAISQAVKKLEEICGFSLVEHDRNHFQLTIRGKILLEKIQPLLQQIKTLEQCFSDLREEKEIQLHVGCMHSIGLAIFPKIIPQFVEIYPQAKIDFRFGNGKIILDLIKEGEIDFGIILDNDDLSSFHTIPIHKGTFEVFSMPNSRIDKLLMSEPSFEANVFKKHYHDTFGTFPTIEMKIASWEVIASLAEIGFGKGFFPDYLLAKHPHLKKVDFPFPSISYSMIAVFRQASFISKPVKSFLEVLRNCFLQPQLTLF